MKDMSFIIPIRVDNEERVDNCSTILRFLHMHFPQSEVLLIEQDAKIRTQSIIESFPAVRRSFELNPGKFSKSLAVNRGIALSTRELICMWDADILVHPGALRRAADMLRSGIGRVVIPHNRIFLDVSGALKDEISSSFEMEKYGRVRRFSDVPVRADLAWRECHGGIFVGQKEVLKLTGGLNKKMISYGWQDIEFLRRLDKLGYYSFMLPDFNLVHLDHPRGPDSHANEMYDINRAEFEKVNGMSRRQLQSYVETDLDIAEAQDRALRSSLRRRQALMNLLTMQWLAHVVNKVLVHVQINGVSRLLRRLVYET